jgi:uncharacterized protein GlcG (DUF336 family)
MRLTKICFIFVATSLLAANQGFSSEGGSVLTLETAKSIAQKAATAAAEKMFKVSIAIVNAEGNLLYFERGNGSVSGSVEASIQKAKSANAWRRPTSAFVEGVRQGRIGLLSVKDVVAMEGGVPIMSKGEYVGAIGVSGAKATEDEDVANAALK